MEAYKKEGGIEKLVHNKNAYEWSGYSHRLSAQIVGEEMERIREEYGGVTKENFLEAARPSDSVTHCLFDWDDSVAGEKWRLHQSKVIIGSVKMTVCAETPQGKTEYKVRAFVNKEVDDDRKPAVYIPFLEAMNGTESETTRRITVENAKRELFQFANKFRTYEEFAGVIDEIDKLKEGESLNI